MSELLRIYKKNLTISEAKKIIDVLESLGYNFSHIRNAELIFVDVRGQDED